MISTVTYSPTAAVHCTAVSIEYSANHFLGLAPQGI